MRQSGIYVWPEYSAHGQDYGFWFLKNGEDDKSNLRYNYLPLRRTKEGITELMKEIQSFEKLD